MRGLIFIISFLIHTSLSTQDIIYNEVKNISYYEDQTDQYRNEKCVVDIYYPSNKKAKATIVWFHGGGLTQGVREIPTFLKDKELINQIKRR